MKRVMLLVALAACAFAPLARSTAQAASLPDAWCGPGEATSDLPDLVAGAQIHVIYAYAADAPDRFDLWALPIARDLAGVDAWWRTQDPTREPRFDLADFPSCGSTFGQLDISTLPLKNPSATYTETDRTSLATSVRSEISSTFGKAYLVYLDVPVSDDVGACGYSRWNTTQPATENGIALVFLRPARTTCLLGGGFGTGNGWPARTAAHELSHLLAGNLGGAAHACPDDTVHVCDPGVDILWSAGPAPYSTLSQAALDPGNDDYYAHGIPNRWDMRNSAWLTHLDAPQYPVGVSIGQEGGGQVASNLPGIHCPPRCSADWDSGTILALTAVPAAGYVFGSWSGDCQGSSSACLVNSDAPRSVTANFALTRPVEVRISGPGHVSSGDSDCADRCVWDEVQGSRIALIAHPSRHASFVGWSGACRGTHERCDAKVRDHTTVTARFARK